MSPSITSQPSEEGGKHQEPPDLTLPESKTQRGQNVVSEETVSTVNQLIMLKKDTSIDAKGVSDVKSEETVLTSTPLQKPELDNNMEAASRKKDYLTRIFSRRPSSGSSSSSIGPFQTFKRKLFKFAKFVGPGFLVSVAYIDPGTFVAFESSTWSIDAYYLVGNYATDVAAGASYRYRLLFVVLLSNIFAIFLQSLCIKLGSVTGMNLAENCKAHLPPWLNYVLYFFAEAAIIATDIAEVREWKLHSSSILINAS
jgi:metal iron transporter